MKNMGGLAASAAVIGTTMVPVARAAGLSSPQHGNEGDGGCWDNDHYCQHQSCCYDQYCGQQGEQFDYSCYFEIQCQTDQNNHCWFDVYCQGNGLSWRKSCNDGHKRKHHWRFKSCEGKSDCGWGNGCQVECKLWCHCKDDDGCNYQDHCINFCVYCYVDGQGCCCYTVQCNGFSLS